MSKRSQKSGSGRKGRDALGRANGGRRGANDGANGGRRGETPRAGRAQAKTGGANASTAGGAAMALPALSSLTNVPAFDELSCSDGQRRAYDKACEQLVKAGEAQQDELRLGCVVRLDRGFPAIVTKDGVARAEFSAQLTKGEQNNKVAVGDWVCVRCPADHDMWLIQQILPRTSDIARWRGKARGEKQTLAANVDVVLVAQALGERPISCDRIARSAVIARDCGASVAVVLTKADRASLEVLERDVRAIREVLGDQTPVVVTSSRVEREEAMAEAGAFAAGDALVAGDAPSVGDATPGVDAPTNGVLSEHVEGQKHFSPESVALKNEASRLGVLWGTAGVRSLVAPGVVAIVLGESGAGKSTLLNALLHDDVLRTGGVRQSDDAGRHTTVSRRMVSLPGAGVIVDEPGLRSLPLVGHERGLAKVFPDVAEAAQDCRFRDCTHTHEPGCKVREGLAAGLFPAGRVDTYVALASEMRRSAASLDPDVVL